MAFSRQRTATLFFIIAVGNVVNALDGLRMLWEMRNRTGMENVSTVDIKSQTALSQMQLLQVDSHQGAAQTTNTEMESDRPKAKHKDEKHGDHKNKEESAHGDHKNKEDGDHKNKEENAHADDKNKAAKKHHKGHHKHHIHDEEVAVGDSAAQKTHKKKKKMLTDDSEKGSDHKVPGIVVEPHGSEAHAELDQDADGLHKAEMEDANVDDAEEDETGLEKADDNDVSQHNKSLTETVEVNSVNGSQKKMAIGHEDEALRDTNDTEVYNETEDDGLSMISNANRKARRADRVHEAIGWMALALTGAQAQAQTQTSTQTEAALDADGFPRRDVEEEQKLSLMMGRTKLACVFVFFFLCFGLCVDPTTVNEPEGLKSSKHLMYHPDAYEANHYGSNVCRKKRSTSRR